MRFLVTGAQGFVGRELVRTLARCGHTGIATGRHAPKDLPAGWQAAERDRMLSIAPAPPPIDAIVHLEVKQHIPRPTAADIERFERVNVDGTRAWLDWATRHGVRRFVFTSSIKAVAPSCEPHSEEAPLTADTPYARSKARGEALVVEWASQESARAAVILRPAPVYGPGNEANLAAFVRQIRAGKPCIVGPGATRKSIVSRRNLAAAIEFAALHARPGVEVFNVSDRDTPSVAGLAAMIADLAHAPPPRHIPEWLARGIAIVGDAISAITRQDFPLTSARLHAMQETSVFPCDKLMAAGFEHPQTTREGLEEMLLE